MPAHIGEIASKLGLGADEWIPYGHDKAKLSAAALARGRRRPGAGKLVLVSAITPTPAGEGKTTTSIGLAQGLNALGESVCLALREPSLGPCLGMKGGATGGGRASLTPSTEINLHFTGDLHAITSANNLIAAVADNAVHFGTRDLDARRMTWRRVLDMNDRALRDIVTGLGGASEGVPRETGFDITAASEVMAALCLARDADDLRARLGRMHVGAAKDGTPVTVDDLNATGACMALLRDAMLPNLVQTLDGVPALVHGGPFANIAHGCNSVIATRAALDLADWVVTEAGFAFDLGGQKFLDIKCVQGELDVSAIVLVATVRALKMHGGVALADLKATNVDALRRGLENLDGHLAAAAYYERPIVVAINRFGDDSDEEIAAIAEHCASRGVGVAAATHFAHGAEGAMELARVVREAAAKPHGPMRRTSPDGVGIVERIEAIAKHIYGADGVDLTRDALRDLKRLEKIGLGTLPVCVAKTQYSFSDDPTRLGRPSGFRITVRGLRLSAGAGFVVALTGDIVRMPGLPKVPASERIDVRDGAITGLA